MRAGRLCASGSGRVGWGHPPAQDTEQPIGANELLNGTARHRDPFVAAEAACHRVPKQHVQDVASNFSVGDHQLSECCEKSNRVPRDDDRTGTGFSRGGPVLLLANVSQRNKLADLV